MLVKTRTLALDVVGGGAGECRQHAGAGEDGLAAVVAQAGCGGCLLAAGARAVHAHGGLGGVGRRRAADRGDVVEQGAVGVVADGGDHRNPQQGHGAAERLIAEAQQVGQRAAAAGHDHDLHLRHGQQI